MVRIPRDFAAGERMKSASIADPSGAAGPGTAPGVGARWAGPVSSVINYKIEVNAAHPLFIPGRTGSGSIRDGKHRAQPLWAPQTPLPSRGRAGRSLEGPRGRPDPAGAAGGIPALQLRFPLIPAPLTAAAGLRAAFPKEKKKNNQRSLSSPPSAVNFY